MKFIKKTRDKIFLRDGHFILLAHLADKVINFVIMIIAARYMSLSTYGQFSYVKSIVASLTPFSGLGGNHSLLRFGMDSEDIKKKYNLLLSSLLYGVLFTLVFIFVIKYFLNQTGFLKDIEAKKMFDIYIYFILSYYVFDIIRNYYRIINDNKAYAFKSIKYSILTLLLSSAALILFNEVAFLITIVALPLLVSIFDSKIFFVTNSISLKFKSNFWKYGFLIGLGAFLNQFFLQSDILILGYLNINPELIAQYKVATLLVYTFLFIPNAFLVRDFTTISSNASNELFLRKYIIDYYKHAVVVLLVAVPLFYIFCDDVLALLFGEKFITEYSIQKILIYAFVAMVLLRMPFGNVLNAVGKANLNVINAVITIVIAIPSLVFLTKMYGIQGTAFAMVSVFFISGIMSILMFNSYLNMLRKNS